MAEPFLDWLALPEGLQWLDDGCGDGSFTEVLMSRQRPTSVVGVDPAPAQLDFARHRAGTTGASFVEGDAQALPLPDASVDAAVMALVLFFLPDPAQGLRELARVVRPGGTIAAYHWDMAGGGFPLQPILDAVRAEGYPSQAPPSTWAASLQASESLWRSAGLVDVQTRQIEVHRSFDSFDDFWRTAYGSHRLRDLFTSLSSAALQRLNDRVREGLGFVSDGPLVLQARANAVKGRKHCRAHRPLSLARAPAQGNRCGPAADGRNLPVKTAIGRTPHRRLVADSGCTRGVAALPTRSTASFLALGQVDDGPAPTQSRQTPAAV